MPLDFQRVFQRATPYQKFLDAYATPEQKARWAAVYDAAHLSAEQKEILQSFRRKMPVICLSGPWCGDCVAYCPLFQRIAEGSRLIDLRFINRVRDFKNGAGAPAAPRTGTADDPEDIRSTQLGRILIKWGILTPERVEKALLTQGEQNARGLNVRIGDVMTDMGFISAAQRDKALAAQSGYDTVENWDSAIARELSICGGSRVPMLLFLSEDWHECERFGERTLTAYREKARKKLAKLEGASCPTGLMPPSHDVVSLNLAEWFNHFERVQWMLLTSPRLAALHGEV